MISRVELIDFEEGFSTSKIIEKIKDKNDNLVEKEWQEHQKSFKKVKFKRTNR